MTPRSTGRLIWGADIALERLVAPLAGNAALGLLLERMAVPAAYFLAGVALGGAAHLSGLVVGDLPPWLTIPAFGLMGALIGSQFAGVTLALLGRAASAGAVITVFSFGVAAAFAIPVAWWLHLSVTQALIACCPCALETMAALAIQTGVDTADVAAYLTPRLLLLSGRL
ncbi:MAG: AbrB family transcriptional regulator [Pseudomonadota bacterium]